MNPALLDNKELRRDVTGWYYKMMKKIAEILNQNLVRNYGFYLYSGGKVDPDNEFPWVGDSYKKEKDKLQLGYKSLGLSLVNIWQNFKKELQLNILSYLNAIDLITLCYVSKYFRTLVLKKNYKHYNISTGFCAIKYWINRI